MLGVLVVCGNAFVSLKFCIGADAQMIMQTRKFKGRSINFPFLAGSLISTIAISTLVLTLNLFFFLNHKSWSDDDGTGEWKPLTEA